MNTLDEILWYEANDGTHSAGFLFFLSRGWHGRLFAWHRRHFLSPGTNSHLTCKQLSTLGFNNNSTLHTLTDLQSTHAPELKKYDQPMVQIECTMDIHFLWASSTSRVLIVYIHAVVVRIREMERVRAGCLAGHCWASN